MTTKPAAVPRPQIAVEPPCWRADELKAAVEAGGADVVSAENATALIWADPQEPHLLASILQSTPRVDWIQLPYAGIEPYLDLIDSDRRWTCGKGIYAEPVAEMALTLALVGLRGLVTYSRAKTWEAPIGLELRNANVVVLGGGGITEQLLPLLKPFNCDVTVVRKRATPLSGANRVVETNDLIPSLRGADVVILALALTPETRHIIGAAELAAMPNHAWLINVARGAHISTEALLNALTTGSIGGAALDVTDPEPLPDNHPLWNLPNCIVTPHVANTPEMGLRLLKQRITENVRRYRQGETLLGPVYAELGY